MTQHRGSNPRPPELEAEALPNELFTTHIPIVISDYHLSQLNHVVQMLASFWVTKLAAYETV